MLQVHVCSRYLNRYRCIYDSLPESLQHTVLTCHFTGDYLQKFPSRGYKRMYAVLI